MSIRFWWIPVLVSVIAIGVHTPAQCITTVYRGETVEWELTAGGSTLDVSLLYCEDIVAPGTYGFSARCFYAGKWPPLGSEVRAKAVVSPPVVQEIPPDYFDGGSALDVCFPEYYTDCIRSADCNPLVSEDWALFHPMEATSRGEVNMVYQRRWLRFPSGSITRILYIYVYLYNTEMWSIDSMPWLKGDPEQHRQTRYRPRHGGGPGR